VNALRRRSEEYLAMRRGLGYKLVGEGLALANFANFVVFAEAAGAARITTDLAVAWANKPMSASPAYLARRMRVVRSFARHLQSLEPGARDRGPAIGPLPREASVGHTCRLPRIGTSPVPPNCSAWPPIAWRHTAARTAPRLDPTHTCAAILIAQGGAPEGDPGATRALTIRLTFDRYGHLFPGLDERLRDGLEAGFRAAQQTSPPNAIVREIRP
jgi:hypothetical protein